MTQPARARAAHRPSRRAEIIDAAVQVFANTGYAEANVDDIAAACGVAPTAIYYHFGGKEELFNEALRSCLDGFSSAAGAGRPADGTVEVSTLRDVVHAGWDWWRTHPDQARFVARHAGGGNTLEGRRIYQAWIDLHARRGLDYLEDQGRVMRNPRRARQQKAAQMLTLRVVVSLITRTQVASLSGVLGDLPGEDLERAVSELCVRLIVGQAERDY